MEWKITELENGLTRLAISGRMDIKGTLEVDPVFASTVERTSRLVVDMSDVSFLASLGIRTLVMSCKSLAAKGGNLVLLGLQPGVEKVLRTSGLHTMIPTATDMAAAEAILLS